jgi:hypothetical protein
VKLSCVISAGCHCLGFAKFGRPRKIDARNVVNAISFIAAAGRERRRASKALTPLTCGCADPIGASNARRLTIVGALTLQTQRAQRGVEGAPRERTLRMPARPKTRLVVSCAYGGVTLETIGAPISAACAYPSCRPGPSYWR